MASTPPSEAAPPPAPPAAPPATAADVFGTPPAEAPPADPPAGAAPPADGQPPADLPPAGGDPAWFAEISGDLSEGEKTSLLDWVKASGVKDINALAKVARDNQAALRASGQVKIPGEGASAAEIATYRKAIGVPDEAKDYGIPVPKGTDGKPLTGPDGEAVEMNTPLLERLAATAHAAGVPKDAYEALVSDFVQAQMEEAGIQDKAEQDEASAKLKEWGTNGNAKLQAVNSALAALGLSRDEALKLRTALGAGRAMDMFAKLGEGLAEDAMLASGQPPRFGITGTQAQGEIDKMIADPVLSQKILVPGTPERARYDRLIAIVGSEAERKQAAGSDPGV